MTQEDKDNKITELYLMLRQGIIEIDSPEGLRELFDNFITYEGLFSKEDSKLFRTLYSFKYNTVTLLD